jgi:hypothetical protein
VHRPRQLGSQTDLVETLNANDHATKLRDAPWAWSEVEPVFNRKTGRKESRTVWCIGCGWVGVPTLFTQALSLRTIPFEFPLSLCPNLISPQLYRSARQGVSGTGQARSRGAARCSRKHSASTTGWSEPRCPVQTRRWLREPVLEPKESAGTPICWSRVTNRFESGRLLSRLNA